MLLGRGHGTAGRESPKVTCGAVDSDAARGVRTRVLGLLPINNPLGLVIWNSLVSANDARNSRFHLSSTGFIMFHGSNPFHGLPERSAILSARLVGESEFISVSCCAQELQYLRLLKASIQQSSTVPSATVRAKDDAEHAAALQLISFNES